MLPSKLVKILPDWASRAVAQPRSWKLFLRCWVATWVCFILILPQRTLEALGTAYALAILVTYRFSNTVLQVVLCIYGVFYAATKYGIPSLFLLNHDFANRLPCRMGMGKHRYGFCLCGP